MSLISGNKYYIEYVRLRPTRIHQSGFVVEREHQECFADYEFIGRLKNGKLHFYDQDAGLDIYLSKDEFAKYYTPKTES